MSDALGLLPDTKPDVAEPWRKVLLDAADLLERDGWCQHTRMNPAGERCLLGALSYVACGDEWRLWSMQMEEVQKLREMIGFWGAAPWNNDPLRTASEVTAALRACARQ